MFSKGFNFQGLSKSGLCGKELRSFRTPEGEVKRLNVKHGYLAASPFCDFPKIVQP